MPLRFTPALCLLFTALGVALRSPLLLAALAVGALVGAAGQSHPFDRFYNAVLLPVVGGPALPPNPPRRRFAFVMAFPILAAAAVAFALGATALGIGLGVMQLVGCATYVASGWCAGAFAHEKLLGSRGVAAAEGLKLHHG